MIENGDYTGKFYLGENNRAVNLLLDTGSSAAAINIEDINDTDLTTTTYVKHLAYGSNPKGFTGPVIQTSLKSGDENSQVKLNHLYVVAIPKTTPMPFGKADGILGLAYSSLNNAVDYGVDTYNLLLKNKDDAIKGTSIKLPTYFSSLEKEGVVLNKFSFYTLRSVPHFSLSDPNSDPLNHGCFILGGGEEATDLYQGEFTTVKLVHDVYYNTNISALYVDDIRIDIPEIPLQASNSIVDSGTNGIELPIATYQKVVEAFGVINEAFSLAIQNQNVKSLEGWPNVIVELEGETGFVKLELSPDTYWQLNGTESGQSVFMIRGFDSSTIILGLPLLNNYYTIFDRSADKGQGVIKFAVIKKPSV